MFCRPPLFRVKVLFGVAHNILEKMDYIYEYFCLNHNTDADDSDFFFSGAYFRASWPPCSWSSSRRTRFVGPSQQRPSLGPSQASAGILFGLHSRSQRTSSRRPHSRPQWTSVTPPADLPPSGTPRGFPPNGQQSHPPPPNGYLQHHPHPPQQDRRGPSSRRLSLPSPSSALSVLSI